MIPADTRSIKGEYEILLNELKQYNPELLDKKRVLAITKSDLADPELIQEMKADLPGIPWVFISSLIGTNLNKLKDILWRELNSPEDD
jgi:GTP-binding protein